MPSGLTANLGLVIMPGQWFCGTCLKMHQMYRYHANTPDHRNLPVVLEPQQNWGPVLSLFPATIVPDPTPPFFQLDWPNPLNPNPAPSTFQTQPLGISTPIRGIKYVFHNFWVNPNPAPPTIQTPTLGSSLALLTPPDPFIQRQTDWPNPVRLRHVQR